MAYPTPEPAPITALRDRAADDLRFIRAAMDRAGRFTAVPGRGGVLMGLSALVVAAAAPSLTDHTELWLRWWSGELVLGVGIAVASMAHKARRAGTRLLDDPGRRFAFGMLPPLCAAAALTVVVAAAGQHQLLPGLWLLLYGTAVVCGGVSSVTPVRAMGACFMTLGVAAFWTAPGWSPLWLGLGFGGLHVVFGAWIARFHGG